MFFIINTCSKTNCNSQKRLGNKNYLCYIRYRKHNFLGLNRGIEKMSLKLLSDETLLQCYADAVKLELSPDFISLLKKEIEKRSLGEKLSVNQ